MTLAEKTRLRRLMDRIWAQYLHPHEAVCLGFIFTTTVDWSVPEERLKLDYFIDGVGAAKGIGISKASVRRALDSLEFDGAIRRRRTLYGYLLSINFDWNPAECRVPRVKGLARPAGLKRLAKSEPCVQSAQREHFKVLNGSAPYTKGNTSKENTSIAPAAMVAPDNFNSLPKKSPVTPSALSQEMKLSRYRKVKTAASPSPLEQRWCEAFRECWPEATVPTWTSQMQGQAGMFMQARPENARAPGLDVFEWCVRSWRTILTARFAWMTTNPPPIFPEVGFLLAFKGHFYDAWNDKERLRSEITMNGKDRRVRQSMHRGMSFEEAQKAADDGDALAQARISVAEKERKLNEMLRRSEARGKPTLPERLARASNSGAWMAGTLRACPVSPGREGASTAFDTVTLDAFNGFNGGF